MHIIFIDTQALKRKNLLSNSYKFTYENVYSQIYTYLTVFFDFRFYICSVAMLRRLMNEENEYEKDHNLSVVDAAGFGSM